ncbi:hypothetical protein G3I01_12365 [Gramella sp. MT6]|uniref:hypothetical protein n=1 Tax=Gramella sp. MT6 TaxID=2705471 RepID=UPI001C5F6858|nr:hypothetical protein [Gramella sp. MT6]QYA26263.1 hypothetical protein G3I01_12365 [Gramella sp. MT6]
MTKSNKKLDLAFTNLVFYDSVVISTVKEDVVIEKEHINKLRVTCVNHFGERDFIYITHRKNPYNVNPIIYIDLLEIETLKGIAVISDNIERLKTANFEKNFSPVPYELFQNKEEAIAWAQSIVMAN